MLKSGFFSKSLVLCLPIRSWRFCRKTEKRVLKLVEWFSGHCRAIKSQNLPQTSLQVVHSGLDIRGGGGGAWGAVVSARKTKCFFFFSNIVFDFAGLFLVAIFVLKSQENRLID